MSDKKIELSRRNALIGLGTVGAASAGAGLGTSAYFSDEEEFTGNMMTAGELDLAVDFVVHEDQGSAGTYTINSFTNEVNGTDPGDDLTVNGDGTAMSQTLDDVKPGDHGHSYFCFTIDDNPAYIWACGELTDTSENGYTEPEPEDDNGEGELEEHIEVDVTYCTLDDQGEQTDTGEMIFSGTLREVLELLQAGVPLDGSGDGDAAAGDQAPFAGTGTDDAENACLCFDWELPTTVGNVIQGDSLEFDLSFHAIQSRHNDGTTNPCIGDLVLLENNEDSPGLEDNGPEGTEPYIEWTLGTDSATDSLEDNQMEVTFNNPANGTMVFDYRVDGESGDDSQYTGQTIGSGPLAGQDFGKRYNWVVVSSGGSETVTLTAFDGVELGARVGAEQNYYIDWIRFDVV
ncbi:SipW-dependent-type signal peptide-containing protein [Halorubrum cibi]|uniref:SipW-cognate class signal peptide n=1 Tax=Halorubrum cibi TaxID=413815 RepID=A0A521BU57_9EURY|nr:SipW-dependent-type signal peptide-containing protein [Halorubrum cibi]SMO50712.1 SipW-cognate class signal peptide [Halorubrum cibi]